MKLALDLSNFELAFVLLSDSIQSQIHQMNQYRLFHQLVALS
jgi:hypothetical protein